MKKSLLALALFGATIPALAQTAVVVDGSIDTGFRNQAAANGSHTTTMVNGQRNTNYIGLSGTEDLGNGNKAMFQIRTNFGSDAQAATTSIGDQNVWMGLQGKFGTVKLGRDFNTQFQQVSAYSVFGTGFLNNRASMNSGSVDARWNNSVSYAAPAYNGFGLTVMAAPQQENATNFTTNSAFTAAQVANFGAPLGARLTYGKGPLTAGLAVSRNGSAGPESIWNIGASYDLGVATVKAQYERDQNTVLAANNKNAYLIGAEGPVRGTPIVLKAQYAKRDAATLVTPFQKAYGIGADYNLSKRTAAYVYYGQQATPISGGSNRDTVVGLRHAF